MRRSPLVFLLLIAASTVAFASRHEVQLQVLSTRAQNVHGVGVGIGPATGAPMPPGGEGAAVETCPLSYPDASHNLTICESPGPTGDATGTVQNRRVEAILTTSQGLKYYVILGCQKQYGWCIPLADHATLKGHLNDASKWLDDYQHRPGTGFMKVALRPDGKKKVTYQIEYAAKVKPNDGTRGIEE